MVQSTDDVERVASVKLLGIICQDNFKMDMHVKWCMMYWYIQSESKHVINSLVDANVRLARLEEASVKQVSALRSLTTPPRVITRSYEVQDCSARNVFVDTCKWLKPEVVHD